MKQCLQDSHTIFSSAQSDVSLQEARDALNRIRSNAGHWHELAKLLPRLSMSGYDSQVVEMETGLERVIQNAANSAVGRYVIQLAKALNQPVDVVALGYMPKPCPPCS